MARIESYEAVVRTYFVLSINFQRHFNVSILFFFNQDTSNETLEKLVKEHSNMFDLCGPMKGCAPNDARNLFMEGDLKFKDNIGKVRVICLNSCSLLIYIFIKTVRYIQVDAHCFLLTDMLLVCKTIAKKGLGTLKVSLSREKFSFFINLYLHKRS